MSEKIKKVRLDIVFLILTIACTYFLGILGPITSFVMLVLYIKTAKEHYKFQKVLLFICFIGIVFRISGMLSLINMENRGIDGLGEALIHAFVSEIGTFSTIAGSFLLLIIDNRKFIFRKKFVLVVLILAISILLIVLLYYLLSTEKVSKDIPTVGDFENELIQREFLTSDTDYRLYGINNKSDKAIALNFEEDDNEQYPLYVYAIIDYPWIIYYANGDIYAAKGKYWDYYTAYRKDSGYNEEKIIWDYSLSNIVKSEKEKISIYNRKYNRYEKRNILINDEFNYYSKNESIENSVFIDIPRAESWGSKTEIVNRIDKKTLGYE